MDQQNEQVPAQTARKQYEKPQATELGQVRELTQTAAVGPSVIPPISTPSDRNIKANFAPVDAHQILEKLAQLPVTSWNYKSDAVTVRHIGPMAQDFAKAFAVGDSDRVIHTADSSGVAIAAIQALHELVREQDERLAALSAEVRELRGSAVTV